MGFLPLSTIPIIADTNRKNNRQNTQRIFYFQEIFVYFAERPGGRKNVERLDFLKFSPCALVKGEARAKKERAITRPRFPILHPK